MRLLADIEADEVAQAGERREADVAQRRNVGSESADAVGAIAILGIDLAEQPLRPLVLGEQPRRSPIATTVEPILVMRYDKS